MDSDKIIVSSSSRFEFNHSLYFFKCLSDGYLKDIGRPYDLLQDASTILHSLLENLNKDEAEVLLEIAATKAKLTNEDDVTII